MTIKMEIDVEIQLSSLLREYVGGASSIRSQGETVRDLLNNLDNQFSGFKRRIVDQYGKLHDYILIYLNDDNIHSLEKLETPLKNGDVIRILVLTNGG
jgi:molybdopterin converting factor small subunit